MVYRHDEIVWLILGRRRTFIRMPNCVGEIKMNFFHAHWQQHGLERWPLMSLFCSYCRYLQYWIILYIVHFSELFSTIMIMSSSFGTDHLEAVNRNPQGRFMLCFLIVLFFGFRPIFYLPDSCKNGIERTQISNFSFILGAYYSAQNGTSILMSASWYAAISTVKVLAKTRDVGLSECFLAANATFWE